MARPQQVLAAATHATVRRAAKLARRLDPDTIPPTDGESDCFIDAMDLALGNGDLAAAEIVARECLLLAESQCAKLREHLSCEEGLDLATAASACA